MGKKPILSISMLVSDRPDTIERCLDSLKPIIEAIPSELILVSTSKSEQVHAIIEKYTDKIVEFEWCDDFAKARNAGLRIATGEWFITLDDDEWFVEIQPLIDFFRSGDYKNYGCANYLVRNFYDPQYQYYSDAWVSRMIRLSKDTHYESKIHEYLYPVEGECKNIEAIAYHSGYIFASEEARLDHFKRNEHLLQKMISEEPDRLRWRVQLLQEYRSVHAYEQMYEEGMRCIERFRDKNNTIDNRDIGTFYVAAAEGKLFLNDEDEAYRIGALAIKDSRTSELCHAYVMLLYSVIFYREGKWAEAEHAIKTYFQIEEYLKQNPERFEIQKGALLVSEAYDEMALKKIYSIRIVCGFKRNDTSLLKKYFKELEWEQDSVYLMDGFMRHLVDAMAHLQYEEYFVEVLLLAWNHPQLRNALLGEVAPYEESDPEGFKQLVRYLSKLPADHWYLWYAKILAIDVKADKELFAEYVKSLLDTISNIFCLPDSVVRKANDNHVDLEELYLQIPLDKWEEHWKMYVAENGRPAIQSVNDAIERMQTHQDIHYALLNVRSAEYGAFGGCDESVDYEEMRRNLEKFANTAIDFVQNYPDQQNELGEVAQEVNRALTLENENPKEAIQCWGDISQHVPEYAAAIKRYLLAFNNCYQNQEVHAKKEMEKLKSKIMVEVQKCMSNQDYATALTILEQLKQMMPADLDVAELILQARMLYIKQNI